jgi:hypothetical protein
MNTTQRTALVTGGNRGWALRSPVPCTMPATA